MRCNNRRVVVVVSTKGNGTTVAGHTPVHPDGTFMRTQRPDTFASQIVQLSGRHCAGSRPMVGQAGTAGGGGDNERGWKHRRGALERAHHRAAWSKIMCRLTSPGRDLLPNWLRQTFSLKYINKNTMLRLDESLDALLIVGDHNNLLTHRHTLTNTLATRQEPTQLKFNIQCRSSIRTSH